MGLMLSILVVCVGVIEALSCFDHFRNGILHGATHLYENIRRGSTFLAATGRRLKLLRDDNQSRKFQLNTFGSLDESSSNYDSFDECAQAETSEKRFFDGSQPSKKLANSDKIEIVKNRLEKEKNKQERRRWQSQVPKVSRSYSMPDLVYTPEDMELNKIINELAIEPIIEVNLDEEIDETDSEIIIEEFDHLFGEEEVPDVQIRSHESVEQAQTLSATECDIPKNVMVENHMDVNESQKCLSLAEDQPLKSQSSEMDSGNHLEESNKECSDESSQENRRNQHHSLISAFEAKSKRKIVYSDESLKIFNDIFENLDGKKIRRKESTTSVPKVSSALRPDSITVQDGSEQIPSSDNLSSSDLNGIQISKPTSNSIDTSPTKEGTSENISDLPPLAKNENDFFSPKSSVLDEILPPEQSVTENLDILDLDIDDAADDDSIDDIFEEIYGSLREEPNEIDEKSLREFNENIKCEKTDVQPKFPQRPNDFPVPLITETDVDRPIPENIRRFADNIIENFLGDLRSLLPEITLMMKETENGLAFHESCSNFENGQNENVDFSEKLKSPNEVVENDDNRLSYDSLQIDKIVSNVSNVDPSSYESNHEVINDVVNSRNTKETLPPEIDDEEIIEYEEEIYVDELDDDSVNKMSTGDKSGNELMIHEELVPIQNNNDILDKGGADRVISFAEKVETKESPKEEVKVQSEAENPDDMEEEIEYIIEYEDEDDDDDEVNKIMSKTLANVAGDDVQEEIIEYEDENEVLSVLNPEEKNRIDDPVTKANDKSIESNEMAEPKDNMSINTEPKNYTQENVEKNKNESLAEKSSHEIVDTGIGVSVACSIESTKGKTDLLDERNKIMEGKSETTVEKKTSPTKEIKSNDENATFTDTCRMDGNEQKPGVVDEGVKENVVVSDSALKNKEKPNEDIGKKAAPQAFWLIFSGEYTKAMSKDWHSGHFSCWQCDEALTGQRYVLRDEHPYCIKCYESVFANVCEECNKIIGIDSKDLSYKDKHWHEACFLCNKCRVSLVDKQFGSKAEKIYCGNCYDAQFASRCDGCGEIFRAGTKKMEYKTRQWHEKCFCCCVCKTPIGTKSFIPREQEIYCATCYEEKFATRCVKCNKIITSGGVTYKNEPWHRECFTCTNCNTSLAGQRFTSRDEKPYCADCFGELFAKRCTSCSRPITGIGGTRFISFEDRHWHNDCFICASCKTSLVGRGFITDGDDIICPECAKQKLM